MPKHDLSIFENMQPCRRCRKPKHDPSIYDSLNLSKSGRKPVDNPTEKQVSNRRATRIHYHSDILKNREYQRLYGRMYRAKKRGEWPPPGHVEENVKDEVEVEDE